MPQVSVPPVQVELPSAPPLPPGAQAMDGGYQPPQPTYAGPAK